nr:MAG TPA: hypothetical protein [Caudoviricetes sp.]
MHGQIHIDILCGSRKPYHDRAIHQGKGDSHAFASGEPELSESLSDDRLSFFYLSSPALIVLKVQLLVSTSENSSVPMEPPHE